MIFVTGGNGFLGSNFINNWISNSKESVINIDKGYNNIKSANVKLVELDIFDWLPISKLIQKHKPRAIIHFASSCPTNSDSSPTAFFKTNAVGTLTLLDIVKSVDPSIRFIHISTDEVYGNTVNTSSEDSAYLPDSPYAASKAASDHIVRAYNKTYGLDTIITNCSNVYGIKQSKDQFIPKTISYIISGKNITLDLIETRDWLHVNDHCSAIRVLLEKGISGEKYNIGGDNLYSNLEIIDIIKEYVINNISNEINTTILTRSNTNIKYDINSNKLKSLGWKPSVDFKSGLIDTINYYYQQSF